MHISTLPKAIDPRVWQEASSILRAEGRLRRVLAQQGSVVGPCCVGIVRALLVYSKACVGATISVYNTSAWWSTIVSSSPALQTMTDALP